MWNQWSQYGMVQPPLPMAAAPPPPPAEAAQAAAPAQAVMIGPVGPPPAAAPTVAAAPATATAAASNPYAQYTAAQYAALTPEQQYSLQQHWQQWQKYQEDYAKWHAQYGEQYKREIEAAGKSAAAAYQTAPAYAATAPPAAVAKSEEKIAVQPQIYNKPPPQVAPAKPYPPPTAVPSGFSHTQQPPPPPPDHQQTAARPNLNSQPPPQQYPNSYMQSQPPTHSQMRPQQPPSTWQPNHIYSQPPPNFNPAGPPPGNYNNFKNANASQQNQWVGTPPPNVASIGPKPHPSVDTNRGNAQFNYGNNNQPTSGPWSQGPNKNFPPRDEDNSSKNSPLNRSSDWSDWKQRANNNSGNNATNDWQKVANRQDSNPGNWNSDGGKTENYQDDDSQHEDDWQSSSKNNDDLNGSDWSNSSQNRCGNWNESSSLSGRNDYRNADRGRGSINSRGDDDDRGFNSRNSFAGNALNRSESNDRGRSNWSEGPKNRPFNRSNDRNDNRGMNSNQWNNNIGSNKTNPFGSARNQNSGPGNRNIPDLDEEMFDRQFKLWEEQFEDWKRANSNHPDREMYTRYEREFENQRKRIVDRRDQMRRRKLERMGLDPNQVKPSSQCHEGGPASKILKIGDDIVKECPKENSEKAENATMKRGEEKPCTLGKRKSRYENNTPKKITPSKDKETECEVINLDDDENVEDSGNDETVDGSTENMTKIFNKSDGIPGLDLVEDDTSKHAGDSTENNIDDEKESNIVEGNIVEPNKAADAGVADISKTLNDPEFMKKISEAVAKAQGKDDGSNQSDNDNSMNRGGPADSFEDSNKWRPNNEMNNWGPNNNTGPNNWGPNNYGPGPNNWGPRNSWGPNNFGPNNRGPNDNMGPNFNGPNNNMFMNRNNWGPNNRGGNNWGPNNGGPNDWGNRGPNMWGPNNNGPNNNWMPNNGFGPNNFGPMAGNNNGGGPNNWGPRGGAGPWMANNGNNGPWQPNNGPWTNNNNNRDAPGPNWGPNGPNSFRGNNRNFGPNCPGNFNFGQNGPNDGNSNNFNRNSGNRNFGNGSERNFGPEQQCSDSEQSQNSEIQRNSNNPFRKNSGPGDSNQQPFADEGKPQSSKGAGENPEYGDYFRPVQIIDYANNASVAPKVIDYGHQPVSDDFKPVRVINYDHVTKLGQKANMTPPERQRRGMNRRQRRALQRLEKLQQSQVGQSIEDQQQPQPQNAKANVGETNEDQLEDISDTDDLPEQNEARPDSPAPPPPPMLSSSAHNEVISLFPSTSAANENVAKLEVHHVQMSIPTVENSNTISIEEILLPPGRETRPKKICIILRGPPGSGKSHVAKLINEKEKEIGGHNPRVLSIDDYFLVENDYEEKCPKTGKKIPKKEILYEYDQAMEETYMQYLIKSFKKTILNNFYDFIIIDCNNNSLRSLNDFYCHAKDSGYVPYIVDLFCELETCLNQNVHERSEADIKAIIETWKPTPFHYIKLDVSSLLQNVVEMEDADDMAVDENTVSDKGEALDKAEDECEDQSLAADENSNSQSGNKEDDNDVDAGAEAKEDEPEEEDESNDSQENKLGDFLKSKWETDTTTDNLARLDGTSKLNTKRKQTMEEYLQLDDWEPMSSNVPGKKRVRWADIEEKREQEKMRAVGFVVGQTDWKRMMDPNAANRALNKTKYIERVNKNRR